MARRSPPEQWAVIMMNWNKEVNDLKYYGVRLYFEKYRERRAIAVGVGGGNSSSSSVVSVGGGGSGSNNNPKKVAKVALMITREQRTDLSSNLHYKEAEIRKMDPILAHNILSFAVKRSSITNDEELILEKEDMTKAVAPFLVKSNVDDNVKDKEEEGETKMSNEELSSMNALSIVEEPVTSEEHAIAVVDENKMEFSKELQTPGSNSEGGVSSKEEHATTTPTTEPTTPISSNSEEEEKETISTDDPTKWYAVVVANERVALFRTKDEANETMKFYIEKAEKQMMEGKAGDNENFWFDVRIEVVEEKDL